MVACIYIAPDQPSSITPVVTLAAERPWPLVFLATTPRLVGKSLAHALSRTPRKVKWDTGTTPGPSVPITPPEDYICITATCTKSGAGQKCMAIDPRIPGGEVTLNSAGGDISNMRIQYACGSACPGSDPSSSTTSTTTGGGGGGDPHIQTIKGDSYTLTKQGNFLAFSFKGKEALVAPAPYGSGSPGSHSHGDGASRVPVDFELFVHYNDGRKSFTRGLLLLDHQNHQAMEMTSEDCRWRVRAGPVVTECSLISFGKNLERDANFRFCHHFATFLNLFEVAPLFLGGESDWKTLTEWRKSVSKSEVSSDLLYQRGNGAYVTGLNISRAENTFNLSKIEMNTFITGAERNFSGKTLKSYAKAIILINMNTPTGLTDVVKLKVKCYPGYHMNYRVGVYNGKDLRFVGGEVGGTSSEPKETPEFLQVGQGTIQMRSDSGFQYHQSWEELGGSGVCGFVSPGPRWFSGWKLQAHDHPVHQIWPAEGYGDLSQRRAEGSDFSLLRRVCFWCMSSRWRCPARTHWDLPGMKMTEPWASALWYSVWTVSFRIMI